MIPNGRMIEFTVFAAGKDTSDREALYALGYESFCHHVGMTHTRNVMAMPADQVIDIPGVS